MAQTNIKVSELVNKVQRGELTLLEMQRRYVWPATRSATFGFSLSRLSVRHNFIFGNRRRNAD